MMPKWTRFPFLMKILQAFLPSDNDLMEALPDELPKVMFMEPPTPGLPRILAPALVIMHRLRSKRAEFLLKVYKAFHPCREIWEAQ